MASRRRVPSADAGLGSARRLRRWLASELRGLRPAIEASAAGCGAEHARKHVTSYQHLCLLLFHGLSSHRSPRQSYEQFGACDGLVAARPLAATDRTDRLGVGYSEDRRRALGPTGHPRPSPDPPRRARPRPHQALPLLLARLAAAVQHLNLSHNALSLLTPAQLVLPGFDLPPHAPT